jgi:hypothetical protein
VDNLAKKMKNNAQVYWDSKSLRFRCFAHIINLAAQAALEKIRGDIDKVILIYMIFVCVKLLNFLQVRSLHSAIRASPQRIENLEAACQACEIQMLKPILDCNTRWNSTHDMLENSIKLKPVVFLFNSYYL